MDWNDIGQVCRQIGNEREALDKTFANRIAPGRNFWKEAADEIDRLRAEIAKNTTR